MVVAAIAAVVGPSDFDIVAVASVVVLIADAEGILCSADGLGNCGAEGISGRP